MGCHRRNHLGPATNTTGASTATQRYFPWGAKRSTTEVPTLYRFTGQREESTIGLYFYNARWYDAALGRFAQADTIVPEPGNPQSLNRYSSTLNNPVRYTDPSGHAFDAGGAYDDFDPDRKGLCCTISTSVLKCASKPVL